MVPIEHALKENICSKQLHWQIVSCEDDIIMETVNPIPTFLNQLHSLVHEEQ